MHLLQLFSLVLSLTMTAFASLAAPGHHLGSSGIKSVNDFRAMGISIKDFLISDVYTQSLSVPATANYSSPSTNTSISFVFSDPNSNTSTICSDTWNQTGNSTTAPFSYVVCDRTNVTEFFQWKFTSYTSLDTFQIMFAHIFSDPVDFPPPFSVIEYFSASTNFTLACGTATGLGGCQLPASQSPAHAAITGISG